MAGGGGGGVAALVLAEGPGPERQCNRPGPPSIMAPFHSSPEARVWQGESLEIGQDDRGASPWAGLALGCLCCCLLVVATAPITGSAWCSVSAGVTDRPTAEPGR